MKFDKPHIYFWVTSILIFAIGFFYYNFEESEVVSLNIYDTYYIIETTLISSIVSVSFLFSGLVYWSFIKLNIRLFKVLNTVHFLASIGIFLIFIISLEHFNMFFFKQYNKKFPLFDDSSNQDLFNIILFYFFFFIQSILILNVIISTFRHFFKRMN